MGYNHKTKIPNCSSTEQFGIHQLVEHKWKAARQYLEWDSTSQTVAQVRKTGQGLGSITATAQFVHFVFAQFGNVIIFQVVQ